MATSIIQRRHAPKPDGRNPSESVDDLNRNDWTECLGIRTTLEADEKILEKAALQDSYSAHLERIGLIRSHYRPDRNTGIPEFDKFTERPSVSYMDITTLGRLVLKQIDLLKDNESG